MLRIRPLPPFSWDGLSPSAVSPLVGADVKPQSYYYLKVKVTRPWKLRIEVACVMIFSTEYVFSHSHLYICALDCDSHTVGTVPVLSEPINYCSTAVTVRKRW